MKNAKECLQKKISGDFTDEFLEWNPAYHDAYQHMIPRPCYRVMGIYLYQGSD